MKLNEARMCVECEEIYADAPICPSCCCTRIVWLATMLGTKARPSREPLPWQRVEKRLEGVLR